MLLEAQIKNLRQRVESSSLVQYRPVKLTYRAFWGMVTRDATHNAAGVAYFAILSLFPLLLGVLSAFGMLLSSEDLQRRFISFVSSNLPGSAAFVESNVDAIINLRGTLGIGAVLGALWLGTAVFAAISRAVNRAWGIYTNRPFYLALPHRFIMGFITGNLFLLSTTATSLIQFFTRTEHTMAWQWFLLDPETSRAAVYLLPWSISLLIFLMIYKLEPRCQTYWQYVWPGAVVASILFEAAKILFVWYLDNVASYNQVHGSLASIVVLLFWVYLCALILILGAQVSHQYELLYRPGAEAEPEEVEEDESQYGEMPI